MRLLITIPCLTNGVVLRECVEQVLHKRGITLLLLDNGATDDVKEAIQFYSQYPQVIVKSNPENVFVNPAWNFFIEFFIAGDYDRLLILNSDLTMNVNWFNKALFIWEFIGADYIIVPTISNDKTKMFEEPSPGNQIKVIPHTGVAGVFITLTKDQAKTVYPIPREIKVWFGDTWIYTILGELGVIFVTTANILAFHHTSTSITSTDGIREIIEQDKLEWHDVVYPLMQEKIKHLKGL
jgi:hypothetical protein